MMQRLKKVFRDFVFGSMGLAVMNAVLSLLVYPAIERQSGAAMQGRILFFTSLATLMGSAFGCGANYGRLKIYSEEKETENGEYNIFLLISAVIVLAITLLAVLVKRDSAGAGFFGVFAVIYATTVRFYSDAGFRLELKYGHYSLFYIAAGAGYLLGLLLFYVTGQWILIFLCGELFAILYAVIFSGIYRRPFFRRTGRFGQHLKVLFSLSGSFLLSDSVSAADRMLLPLLVSNGDELTSLYYYASLVGKIVSLVSTPLNGVLSGHISRKEGGLSRKDFLKILLLMLGVFLLATLLAVFGSHLFVWLFYRDYYETVKPLFLMANAGQVVFFICNTMMVIVLRYTRTRNQLIVSISYIAVFFGLTIPLILNFGITGMAAGILGANVFKFLMYAVIGFFGLRKEA